MKTWQYIPPWALQVLGVIILVATTGYWAITGHQSALIIGAAMALIGLGAYSGVRITVHQEIDKAKAKERVTESVNEYADDRLHSNRVGEDNSET